MPESQHEREERILREAPDSVEAGAIRFTRAFLELGRLVRESMERDIENFARFGRSIRRR